VNGLLERAQHFIELRALGAAALVDPRLDVEQAEQTLALDVAGAAVFSGAGVLVFHGARTVRTKTRACKVHARREVRA